MKTVLHVLEEKARLGLTKRMREKKRGKWFGQGYFKLEGGWSLVVVLLGGDE